MSLITERHADGTVLNQYENGEPEPIPEAPGDPNPMSQLTALGAALLADPDGFARMVSQVAGSNTAKGPLSYLADALKAAEQT